MTYSLNQRSLITRITIYLTIGFIYYWFMSNNAPLGIDWISPHKNRVINSIDNILNSDILVNYGLTTENPPDKFARSLESGKPFDTYLIPIHYYLHLVIASLIGGKQFVINLGQNLDRIAILSCAILTAEICRIFFPNTKSISKSLISISAFSLFISTPWTYRMVIATWLEVYFLLFFLISQICFIYKRKNIGFLSLLFSSLAHYQWGFFLFLFYSSILLIGLSSRNISKVIYLLPPGLNRVKDKFILLSTCLLPSILFFLIIKIFTLNNPQILPLNSSAFYRIGIDSLSNIYHGGWLASLQFLGGNRITICIPDQQKLLNFGRLIENRIYLFNCSLSIIGTAILSITSLVGCFYLHTQNRYIRFITFPTTFSLFAFAFIFQQSFATHLQGYSFIFAFIFVLGIISSLLYFIFKFGTRYYAELIYIPIVFGIIINNVRVSYLTGMNG